jgi:hypothetical protein
VRILFEDEMRRDECVEWVRMRMDYGEESGEQREKSEKRNM